MQQKKLNKSGFTLIELLIVISLIGVLSVFFINTSTLNLRRARDARRKTDLELIRSGIETYRADCNKYPTSNVANLSTLTGDGSNSFCISSNTYITKVPKDPSTGRTYVYSTANLGQTYQICASLEAPPSGSVNVTCAGSTTSCGGTCNYEVVNP